MEVYIYINIEYIVNVLNLFPRNVFCYTISPARFNQEGKTRITHSTGKLNYSQMFEISAGLVTCRFVSRNPSKQWSNTEEITSRISRLLYCIAISTFASPKQSFIINKNNWLCKLQVKTASSAFSWYVVNKQTSIYFKANVDMKIEA